MYRLLDKIIKVYNYWVAPKLLTAPTSLPASILLTLLWITQHQSRPVSLLQLSYKDAPQVLTLLKKLHFDLSCGHSGLWLVSYDKSGASWI